MPDLKSELSKVINSWETPVATPTPTYAPSGHRTTTNSTRTTFNYVRDNPGMTRAEVIAGLAKVGVKLGSSSSLIATLVARGNLRLTSGGLLFATQKEYKPLPNPKTRVVKKKAAPVVEAPVAAPAPTVATTYATPADWTVESVVDNLNVRQAMAVYAELRKIFGE